VTVEAVLGSERWRDDAEIVDTQHCKLTSAAKPVSCNFKRKDWQYAYTATAVIADPRGRAVGFVAPVVHRNPHGRVSESWPPSHSGTRAAGLSES
jgi:hypothetical protein